MAWVHRNWSQLASVHRNWWQLSRVLAGNLAMATSSGRALAIGHQFRGVPKDPAPAPDSARCALHLRILQATRTSLVSR